MMWLYRTAFNLMVLSFLFLVWQIQEDKKDELRNWLHDRVNKEVASFLISLGFWSIEHVATSSIHILPNEVLKNGEFVDTYRLLKQSAINEVMLPLWLRDKGLHHYSDLHHPEVLIKLGYKDPAEIFQHLVEQERLDTPERHVTRDNIHQFKQAVAQFVSGPRTGPFTAAKKLQYEQEITSWSWFFSPHKMYSYLISHKMAVLYMIAFAVFNHMIVTQAVSGNSPGNSNITYSLITFWIHPLQR